MQIARKRSFYSQKYIQLSYIESTGTQYIDTGIFGNTSINFQCKCQLTKEPLPNIRSDNKDIQAIMGWADSTYNSDYRFHLDTYRAFSTGQLYIGSYTLNPRLSLTKPVEISLINNTFTSDGITSTTSRSNYNAENLTTNYYLFAHNNGKKTNIPCNFGNYRLYYFKFLDKNLNLLRDFIPVKDSHGKICLYDKITQQFFYNKGTGEFIAGYN